MDCKIVKLNNDDQFISKIINSDDKLMQFYQFDAMSKESYKIKMNASPNGREKNERFNNDRSTRSTYYIIS